MHMCMCMCMQHVHVCIVQCGIFSQSPYLRVACMFSLERSTFAILRPNLAYFRILLPFDGGKFNQTPDPRMPQGRRGGGEVCTRSRVCGHRARATGAGEVLQKLKLNSP